jgi:hypothetical protein
MQEAADSGHLVATHSAQQPSASAIFPRLTFIESLAAKSLFSGQIETPLREVLELATRLASPGGPAARRELLSTELAIAHTQVSALQALLGSLLAKKKGEGAKLVSRVLNDATSRVATLARTHADLSGRNRPVLLVGHADQVSVGVGGGA